MKIPKNTILNQNNRGDRLGDIWASYNLDLTSNYGVAKVSPRMLLNVNVSDLANLGVPCAFKFFTTSNPYIWAIAGARLFKANGGPNTAFAQDGTSGTPTSLNSDSSDLAVFKSSLCITGASTSMFILGSDGAFDTPVANALADSSGLHQMTYFRAQNKLYTVDDNSAGISSLASDLSTVVLSTSGYQYSLNDLVEGSGVNIGNKISWIASNTSRIWIGTINQSGGQCKIYAWDGSQASGPNEEYRVSANGTLACVIKDDQPVVIDTRGRLLQLNGGAFVEFARLPFQEKDTPTTYFTNATGRLVHYNGMSITKDRINILVNSQLYDTNSTNKENIPAGIWEWTAETGLYHKASLGLTKTGVSITDYGQQKLSAVGALVEMDFPSNSITQGSINGKFICGAAYYTNATTTTKGIFYDDTGDTHAKYGYLTTSWLTSKEDKSVWKDLILRIGKLLNSTDKIVVKYKTEKSTPVEFTGTWTSTSSFTTSTNIVGKEGYEVEILSGTGAGKTAHLLTTGYNATNYVGTLDDTFTGVTTGTFKARVQDWKKMSEFSDQQDDSPTFIFHDAPDSVKIQIKICLEWVGENELLDIFLNTNQ